MKIPIDIMEPKESSAIPDGENFRFQLKWDGVRCLVDARNEEPVLWSKRGRNRTSYYPDVVASLKSLQTPCILDGELVSFGADGTPSFLEIMKRERTLRLDIGALFVAFDLLYVDGGWITSHSLEERLNRLTEVSSGAKEKHFLVTDLHENGQILFEHARENNLEGIVAKQLDSPYVGGKTLLWQKIKCWRHLTADAVAVLVRNGRPKAFDLSNSGSELGRAILLKQANLMNSLQMPRDGLYPLVPPIPVLVRYLDFTSEGKLRHGQVTGLVHP